MKGRAELHALTGSYLRLLAKNGYIPTALRDAGLSQQVTFRDFSKDPPVTPKETDKGNLMVRTHLSNCWMYLCTTWTAWIWPLPQHCIMTCSNR